MLNCNFDRPRLAGAIPGILVPMVFAAALGSHCLADEFLWPGWLGQNRDGWVAQFEPPKVWPESLKQVWKIEIGEGYASPLVRGDQIFVHSRVGEDELLTCLKLSDGELVWQSPFEVPFKVGGGGEWHGKGPKAAPILADEQIFTMSSNGVLRGWNAETGAELWTYDPSDEFEGRKTPYWGACSSPVVSGDKVIVHFGNDKQGFLAAIDSNSGKEIWRNGTAGASYSSPLTTEIEGTSQVVEWDHEGVTGVDLETGKTLWFHEFRHEGTNQNMPTPSVFEGKILVGGENRGLRCIEPKRAEGAWTVEELWNTREVALNMSTAVMNGSLLYGHSHLQSGRLFCLDSGTGEVLWKGKPRTGEYVNFLSMADHVAALLDNGEMRIIKATGGSYEPVATYQVSEAPTWAPPVFLPDGVLIKDRNALIRLSF
ncbi:MAG: PQQ-binding-like beta-propeller repeat protein [Pirellulaceae bacterium]